MNLHESMLTNINYYQLKQQQYSIVTIFFVEKSLYSFFYVINIHVYDFVILLTI